MKISFGRILLLLVTLLSIPAFIYAQSSKDYNNSYIPKKYIKDSTKPTLVMFTATWCGPCQSMKKKVMVEASVKARLEKMNLLYIDVDSNDGKIYSERFKAAGYKGSIPFFAILDTDGDVIRTRTGYTMEEDFCKFLTIENIKKKKAE